jgi:glucose-6-phosphate isomerase
MDEWTRAPEATANPAYLLAALWYILGNGQGERNMVIVPYSDRLVLLSKYFQQLVMESLGKEYDLDGQVVHQGLSVFGNKGGTDAHAYIQQLNDGRDDFFVTFIEILQDAAEYPIEDGLTMGDYLHTFLAGLTNALSGKYRPVLTISFDTGDAATLGMIIALYERAVACYAELIHVNAFHQPGVEAYKKIATGLNALARSVQTAIGEHAGWSGSAAEFAALAGKSDQAADVAGILAKYAVNRRAFAGHTLSRTWADTDWRYAIS